MFLFESVIWKIANKCENWNNHFKLVYFSWKSTQENRVSYWPFFFLILNCACGGHRLFSNWMNYNVISNSLITTYHKLWALSNTHHTKLIPLYLSLYLLFSSVLHQRVNLVLVRFSLTRLVRNKCLIFGPWIMYFWNRLLCIYWLSINIYSSECNVILTIILCVHINLLFCVSFVHTQFIVLIFFFFFHQMWK